MGRPTPPARRRHGTCLFLLLVVSLAGCGGKTPLVLYCGAGIRGPVAEAAEQFQTVEGVRLECDYAGSEVLLSRIKLSRRGDLYMPGDVHYVDLAAEQDLVASSRTVCYFVPVILVQKGNPKEIKSLADLARPGIKVGLGDPEACAVGRESLRILAKNNIPGEDLNRNVAFRSLTVNELANNVKLKALDAAIVWDAVAAGVADRTDVVPIPPPQNIISTVAIGVLKTSQHPDLAARFVDFLVSDRGREIFKKHHYALTLPQ